MASGDSLVEVLLDDVWTPLPDVRVATTTRTSRRSIGITREYAPGRFGLDINNGEVRYDPVAQPGLRPGAQVRISFDGGAGMVRVFSGEIEDVNIDYSTKRWSYLTFTGLDAASTIIRSDLAELDTPVGSGDTVAERLERILDAIGWPEDRRDIAPGGVELAETSFGGSAWRLMEQAVAADPGDLWIDPLGRVTWRSLAATLQAASMPEETFGRSVGGFPIHDLKPVYDRELVVNEVVYARTGDTPSTVQDESSRDLYTGGVFWTLDATDLPHLDADDADDWAQLTLLSQSTPELWFEELTLVLTGEPALQQAVLGLDISSIIRVVFPPPGGGEPLDRLAFVRGIKHTKSHGRQWRVTLSLASASRLNFLRYDDPDATLDRAGFAPGLSPSFTGGRYVAVADELVGAADWQRFADQAVYRFDDLTQQGDEFLSPHQGALIYRADRGFLFFNGTTWLRPTG